VKVMSIRISACDAAAYTCLMLPTRPSCLFKDALPSRSVFKCPFATCVAVTSHHALLMCLSAPVITENWPQTPIGALDWPRRQFLGA